MPKTSLISRGTTDDNPSNGRCDRPQSPRSVAERHRQSGKNLGPVHAHPLACLKRRGRFVRIRLLCKSMQCRYVEISVCLAMKSALLSVSLANSEYRHALLGRGVETGSHGLATPAVGANAFGVDVSDVAGTRLGCAADVEACSVQCWRLMFRSG